MPAQVGALDALVMLVAILVGLALGALVAWASLLLRTGHPSRPQPEERGVAMPSRAWDEERPSRRSLVLFVLALGEMMLAGLILAVLSAQPWLGLEGNRMAVVLFSLLLLLLVLSSAVGEWRAVRR